MKVSLIIPLLASLLLAGCQTRLSNTPSAMPANHSMVEPADTTQYGDGTLMGGTHKPIRALNDSWQLASPPQKIALLLPLQGGLQQQAEAIRNGFFAAFYAQHHTGKQPEIVIYDTSKTDSNLLYQQATAHHVDVVVGPLLKNNIKKLLTIKTLTIPVLALNQVATHADNLYQFGLSPDSEVRQVAKKMLNNLQQRSVIIAPDNSWGKRIKQLFIEQYQQNNSGEIVASLDYRRDGKLSAQLQQLLNIDESKKRYADIRWVLKQTPRYVPRRRQDIDAIFLVASPSAGRQLLPLLRFYYANNVAIYSISQIYGGYPNHKRDHDLEGVIFVDAPWLIAPASFPTWLKALRDASQFTWPNSYRDYPRFYALGVDAYHLVPLINQHRDVSDVNLSGATGILSLEPDGRIERELLWANMLNGMAVSQ